MYVIHCEPVPVPVHISFKMQMRAWPDAKPFELRLTSSTDLAEQHVARVQGFQLGLKMSFPPPPPAYISPSLAADCL